jgi:hypothetical protein
VFEQYAEPKVWAESEYKRKHKTQTAQAIGLKIVKTEGNSVGLHHVKNLYFQNYLAGIGTLVFPGCQRVIEPVSHLFFINPNTKK